MGENIDIRLARKNGTPIAAILSLRHSSCTVYKYGCSNAKLNNLGSMPFLLWRLIEESKVSEVEKIDFGRSDLDQEGLIIFRTGSGQGKGWQRIIDIQTRQGDENWRRCNRDGSANSFLGCRTCSWLQAAGSYTSISANRHLPAHADRNIVR